MLAHVAAMGENQGKGVGQVLISDGLTGLRNGCVDVVVTYRDGCFVSKVGFQVCRTMFSRLR